MKVYKSRYTASGPFGRVTIVGAGNYAVIRARVAAPEGRLTRVAARQVGGSGLVPYTVDVLDSLVDAGITANFGAANGLVSANPNSNVAELSGSPPATQILDMARVCPSSGSILAGASYADLENPDGFGYANQDKSFSQAPRELYVLLVPTGNGANTVWELILTTQADIV